MAQSRAGSRPAEWPAAGAASVPPQGFGGLVVALLALALGLISLLHWRQGGFGPRPRPRRSQGGVQLPPPWFRPRSHHERLHDPVYLQRMLDAEKRDAEKRAVKQRDKADSKH